MRLHSYKLLFRIFSFLSDKTNGATVFVKYKLLLGTLIMGLVGTSACKSKKEVTSYNDPLIVPREGPTCYIAVRVNPEAPDSINISGQVKEKLGDPAMGVLILIKGTQEGTVSDLEGNFNLTAKLSDTLVISGIGYKEQEIAVSKIKDKQIIELEEEHVVPVVALPPRITCYKVTVGSPIKNVEKEVKGRVTDKSREPLIGVAVVVKGTNNGVITDLDGEFTLKANPEAVSTFSYIGYKRIEVPVAKIDKNKPIMLEEDDMILCYDPVVISYESDPIYARTPKRITKLAYNGVDYPPVSPVGNLDDFQKWMESNIVYSEQMRKDNVQGELILGFSIDKKGKVVDKKVLTKLSPDADNEALRILSSSANWKPGTYNSKAIKTIITIPVNFRLNK